MITDLQKQTFVQALLPMVVDGVGHQYPWLVRWCIAKAARETGWNLDNVLLLKANNALGIKGGTEVERGQYVLYHGLSENDVVWIQDSLADGRDDGKVPWRKFKSVADCFAYFVRLLNISENYQPARNLFLTAVENIYTDSLPGHAVGMLNQEHEVFNILAHLNLINERGALR